MKITITINERLPRERVNSLVEIITRTLDFIVRDYTVEKENA